jgi:MarR family 2-MHQ and catechol resistance regulon transcriptional repressor
MTGPRQETPNEDSPLTSPVDGLTLELNSVFIGVSRAATKNVEIRLSRLDLTPARVAVISILHRNPAQRLTVGEIAAGLHVSSTNISRRLDGLERTGWVQRERNPDDGRSIYIRLTDQGRRKADAILPGIYRSMNEAWSCFSNTDKQELLKLLDRMMKHLQARAAIVEPLGAK